MAETENIIIKDTLDGLGTDAYSDYLAHALCLAGSCKLKYNGRGTRTAGRRPDDCP